MEKIIGKFEKIENFGFVIPEKEKNKGDFFISGKNMLGANSGDIVEIEVLENKKGKNREGKILKILKNNFDIAEDGNIIGIYSEKEGGFGFVDIESENKGYYVFSKNKNGALDGDKVEAKVKIFKGKAEAEIIRIIERKKRLIVGKFEQKKEDFGFVIPNNSLFSNDIFVHKKNTGNSKNGDIVGVEITKWDKKNPEGKIKEILSSGKDYDKRDIDIISLALESGVPVSFSKEVKQSVDNLKNTEEKNSDRKDLIELFTFTIDGKDAKDLDDAISLDTLKNGDYKLYVHIADVSHYIPEKSPIDREALERGTSIYLADRVIPMLPERLSNDLCSLNPDSQKLALTCEMLIGGKTGHLLKTKVYNSVIKSNFRLTYKDVDEIEKGNLKLGDILDFKQTITKELLEKVKTANKLKNKIQKYREIQGILDFDFKETYIEFDNEGNVKGIKEYPKYNSNKIIETFMVSANEAISKEFSFLPFLYRVHEKPNDSDILILHEKLNLFGIKFQIKKNTPKEFAILLEHLSKENDGKRMFLQKLLLRTLTQANYSEDNKGHFGLGLKFYSHFTSPIRRYPDLQIHRIIKEAIENKNKGKYNLKKGRIEHYKKLLPIVAKKSSQQERIAEKLEYKVRDYFVVQFYKNKIGMEFEGIISGMIPKGIFVELPDTSEGFVDMGKGIYEEGLQTFYGTNGEKFKLGDYIKIKLANVDEKLLRLTFEII